jgi:Tol biopolymer transport system component
MGWFWLASVVETDDEKRACLGNVVVINPKNERAQRLLNELTDATLGLTGPVREDLLTGGPRFLRDRRLVLIVAGIVGLVLMLIILVLAGSGGKPVEPTIAVLVQASSATTNAGAVGTGGAKVTPTLPLVQPTLPPTWTPSPESNLGQGPTPLPSPPPSLTGRLVVAQGSLVTSDRSLPIVIMDPYGKNIRKVSQEDVGDYGVLTPDGQRLVYSRFLASTNSQQLRSVNANGTQGAELSTLWNNLPPLANMQMPSVSRNGAVLVFSAINIPENDGSPDLYMLPAKNLPPAGAESETTAGGEAATEEATITPTLITAPPTSGPAETKSAPLIKPVRVTAKESGANTWPSVSPDGKFVVFVSDSKSLGEDGIDLYIVGISGGKPKKLTTDGLDNVEAAPEWSPDGKLIAYQSMPQDSKTSDIYIINADGTNPVKLTEGEGDNIRPHWSPDGKFIAFSSTRNGRWQVFIMEVATKTVYQVTIGKESSICTNWGPK